uniref:Putative heterochromatin organization involved in chromatin silencing n=1 Tax=Lutzomyia longipalpis TaxID=7200 RepID=A0A1B0CA83_LUTLO
MASEKDAFRCVDDPNFAIVCAFLEKFAPICGIEHPDVQELQTMLENTEEEVGPELMDLHIKLMRKTKYTVRPDRWERSLVKFTHSFSNVDAWELEKFGYKKLRLPVRLRILKALLECQFDSNVRFKTAVNGIAANDLRPQPLGRDKEGNAYWSTLDQRCNLRIYQEHLDEETWRVVATSRDELVKLIAILNGNEPIVPNLEGLVDEDSSSNSNGLLLKGEHVLVKQDSNSTSLSDDALLPKKKSQETGKCEAAQEDSNKAVNDKAETTAMKAEESNEKDATEEESSDEEEMEEYKEEKPPEPPEKIPPIKLGGLKNKFNKPSLVSSFAKKEVKTSSRSQRYSRRLAGSVKEVEEEKFSIPDTVLKRPKRERLTLLGKSNIEKINKFKKMDSKRNPIIEENDSEEQDDSDEGEEEEEAEDEEEEDDEEEEEEEEDEEEEYSEAIEEKLMIVKGAGSGRDCEGGNPTFECSEVIVEETMYIQGEGSGVDCDVGNTKDDEKGPESSGSKPMFFFGQPGCLKLSPMKQSVSMEIGFGERPPVDDVTAERSSVSDSINDQKENCTDIVKNEESCSEGEIKESNKISELTEEACKDIEMNPLNDCGGSQENKLNIETESREEEHATNEIDPKEGTSNQKDLEVETEGLTKLCSIPSLETQIEKIDTDSSFQGKLIENASEDMKIDDLEEQEASQSISQVDITDKSLSTEKLLVEENEETIEKMSESKKIEEITESSDLNVKEDNTIEKTSEELQKDPNEDEFEASTSQPLAQVPEQLTIEDIKENEQIDESKESNIAIEDTLDASNSLSHEDLAEPTNQSIDIHEKPQECGKENEISDKTDDSQSLNVEKKSFEDVSSEEDSQTFLDYDEKVQKTMGNVEEKLSKDSVGSEKLSENLDGGEISSRNLYSEEMSSEKLNKGENFPRNVDIEENPSMDLEFAGKCQMEMEVDVEEKCEEKSMLIEAIEEKIPVDAASEEKCPINEGIESTSGPSAELTSGPSIEEIIEPSTESTNEPLKEETNEPAEEPTNEELKESSNLPLFEEKIPSNLELEEKCEVKENLQENFPLDVTMEEKYSMEVDSESALGVNATDRCPMDVDPEEKSLLIADSEAKESSLIQEPKEEEISEEKDLVSNEMEVVESQITNLSVATPEEVKTFESTSTFVDEKSCDETQEETQEVVKSDEDNKDQGEFSGTEELLSVERKEESSSTEAVKSLEVCEEQEESEKLLESEREEDSSSAEVPIENSMDVEISVEGSSKDVVDKSDTAVIDDFCMSDEVIPEDIVPKEKSDVDPEDSEKDTPDEERLPIESPKELADELLPETTTEEQLEPTIEAINEPPTEETNESSEVVAKEPSTTVTDELPEEEEAIELPKELSDELIFTPSTSQTESINEPQPESSAEIQIEASSKSLDDLQTESMTELPREEISDPQEQEASQPVREQSTEIQLEPPTESIREPLTDSKSEEQFEPSNEVPSKESFQEPSPDEQPAKPPTDLPLQEPSSYESSSQSQPLAQMDIDAIEESKDIAEESNTSFPGSIPMSPENYLDDVESQKSNEEDEKQEFSSQEKPIEESMETESTEKSKEIEDGPNTVLFENLPSTSSEISRISTVVGEEIEKSIESDKVAISAEEMLPIEPTSEDVEESKNNADTEEISNIASVDNLSPDPSMDDISIHKEKSEDPELCQEDLSTKEDQSHAQLMDVEENLITTESSNVINLSENKIIESEKIEEDFELEESEIQSKVEETPGDLFLVPTVPKIMEVFSMAHKSTEEDSQGDSSEFINELPTTGIPVKSVEIQSESAVDAEETKEVKIEDFSLQENRENEIDSMECSSLIDRITESLADEDEKSQIDEESQIKEIENQKIDKDVSYSENKIICEEEKIEQGFLERNLVGTSKALESVPQIDSISINQIAEESSTTSENIEFKSQEEAQISQVKVDAEEKEFLSCDEKVKEVDSVDEFKGTVGEAPEKSPAENFPKSDDESLSKADQQSLESVAPEVIESKPIEAEIAENFSEVPEDLSKSPEKKSSELAPKSPITMHKSAGEFSKEFLEPTMCLQVKPTLPEISCVPMEIEESPAAQKIVIPEVAAATILLHDKTKEASSSSDCTPMELEVDIEEEGKVTSAASQPIFFGEVQDLSMAKGSTTKKASKPHDNVPMEIELEDSSKKLRESSEIVLNPPNQQLIVESLNISETKKRKPTKMTAYERRRAMQGTKSSISAVIDRIKAKESESQGIQNLKTRKGIQTRIESTRELSQTTEVTELQELKTDGKIQEKETDAKKLTELKDKVTSHEPIEKATKESENISVKIDNNNEKKIAESLEKMEKSVLPEEKSQPQSTATIPECPKIEKESPENSGLSKKRKISEEKITPEKIEGKRIKAEEQKDIKGVEVKTVTPEKSDEILDSGNEEENISILEMARKTRGRKAQVEKKRKGRNEAKTSKEEEVVSKMETTEKDESEHQVQISPKAKKSDKKRETEEFIDPEDTSKKDLNEEKVEEGSKSSHKSILNLSMDYEPPATIIRLGRKTRGRRPVEVEEVEQGKLQLEDVIPTAKIDKKSSAAEGKLKKADVPSKTAENEESNQFEDLIPVAKIDKNKIVAEKEKVEAKEAVVEKKPYSGRGRGRGRGRRAGTLTRRLGLEIDDAAAIDDTESDQPTVRQSRRIAQLKIREEAERRKMEEEALEKMKQEAIRKKKQEQDDYVPSATSGSDEEYKGTVEKKERGPKKKDSMKWHSGTGTSESEEKDEEEEEDGLEPEYVGSPLFKSDHEFSPESDLEDDSWVPTKMARTVKKDPEDVLDANPEHACQKCRKHDHPEWILLCDSCDKGYHCSCLKPVLFVIPEGDWFCPPCQHAKLLENLNAKLSELDGLIEEKEKEELRLARLAFNAISTDNIIKTEEPVREKSRSLSRSMKAKSSSSSDDNSSDNEPIYKLRKRRQANVSYRFNEYDALINSAIKDEIAVMEDGFSAFEEEAHVTGAGNLGRGKDISTIIEADKEEKLRQLEAQKIAKTDEANSNRSASEDEAQADKNDDSSDSGIIRPRKKIVQIKKKKKLNTLDVSSEDDGSDEDFEESSPDSEDSAESMSSGSENSMELELLRKKNSKAGILTRRSVRSRHKVYDEDFINDDDSDEAEPPPPKRKKKKEDSDFSDFDSDETDEDEEDIDSDDLCDDSDSGSDTSDWRSRRKKAPPRKPPGKPSDKPAIAKKKPKKKDDDDETPYRTGSKKKAVNVLKSDDEQEMTRRTRGKKINFLEDYYDDSSDDGIKPGVKRPDTHQRSGRNS